MNLPAIRILTVCGLDDLADRTGVTHVLSILDPGRPDPEAFEAYDPHHRTALRFHDAIAPGEGIVPPGPADIDAVLAFGDALGPEGEGHLLVHCHMGISRSTAALAALLAQAHPHEGADRVFERLLAVRPQAWPNSLMIAMVDERLGRGGRLNDALARLYARQLGIFPRFDPVMRGLGRAREVEMGRQAATSQAGSNQRSASPS